MSAYGGPSIVSSGLVLNLDAGNIKSYPGSGTSWFDLSGNNNTMALINGTAFNSGNSGNIIFNGSNNYAQINTTNAFAFGTGDLSVFLWAKLTATSTWPCYISIGDGNANGNAIIFYRSHTDFTFRTWVGGSVRNSINTIALNLWYLLGVTRQSGIVYQYINGVLDGQFNSSGSIGNTDPTTLSKNYYTYMTGNISTVQIHNRALSANEVAQNFNALRGRYGL